MALLLQKSKTFVSTSLKLKWPAHTSPPAFSATQEVFSYLYHSSQSLHLLITSFSSPVTVCEHPSSLGPVRHRPSHSAIYPCLSVPFSVLSLLRALHFTGTMDERLEPSARTDNPLADRNKSTESHTDADALLNLSAHMVPEPTATDTLQWTHWRKSELT